MDTPKGMPAVMANFPTIATTLGLPEELLGPLTMTALQWELLAIKRGDEKAALEPKPPEAK
jgi:hypothetical protein